jgi:hypothetical protein
MNLYLVSRPNGHTDYDQYDAFVAAAPSAKKAMLLTPCDCDTAWPVQNETLVVTKIGAAIPGTPTKVILASYNAG